MQCCGSASRITFRLNTDPDPSFQVKAKNLETVLKYAHIVYILACHLQIFSDPDRDSCYHFDADPDPQHWLNRPVHGISFLIHI